jgi:hypothetical protein
MVEKKRWGKKFNDKRDWKAVNEGLVVRGEFLLEIEWARNWKKELKKMNKGKRGSPFRFPESLIRLQAVWAQWIDYRGLEGVTRKLFKYGLIPNYNDFSTIYRRVTKLNIEFELPKDGNISVSTDGTGMKASNSGEYRERLYGDERKKFIKVTISADPHKKKLLDCSVILEGEGESESKIAYSHLNKLINLGLKIDKFYGDSAFDLLDLFNILDLHKIGIAIKPRTLITCDKPGSRVRKREVESYKRKGYKKWAKEKRYGRRWTGTEGIFSAVKRKYGEQVRSSKIENMLEEVKRRFWAYEQVKEYAESNKKGILLKNF